MGAPDLLTALLGASGPSGHEEEPARIWREAASQFAEVTSDTMGSSFARVRAGEGARTLALVGHIDEIGIAVTNIEDVESNIRLIVAFAKRLSRDESFIR